MPLCREKKGFEYGTEKGSACAMIKRVRKKFF